jgi:hypothetical protein
MVFYFVTPCSSEDIDVSEAYIASVFRVEKWVEEETSRSIWQNFKTWKALHSIITVMTTSNAT